MGTFSIIFLSIIANIVESQFMGYPYDYSSMFSGYSGYNPMMSNGMGTMGMNTGFGTFGTGMESLYGGQQAFGAYNPYGNGLFNFGNQGMFGQNAFTGFNNNMFGGATNNGLLGGGGVQQQGAQTFQNTMSNGLNNGNTMRAYGRRSTAQNFNGNSQNYAPTRVGQNSFGCNGYGGGCSGQNQNQGWNSKSKV